MPKLRTIKRELIREPSQPLRMAMDDGKMEDLVSSIRRHGVLLPLVVYPVGDVFEIIDGHRRYVATGMAGVSQLPCNVFDNPEDAKFGMMLDANECREDLSAAEEGFQFLELAEKQGWGIEDLMRAFGRSEGYINERCRMCREFPDVTEKVAARELSWGQAKQIMRCPDPQYRTYLLEQATLHGASVRTLGYMFDQWKAQIAPGAVAPKPHTGEGAQVHIEAPTQRCVWCDRNDDQGNVISVPVHSYHKRDLECFLEAAGVRQSERSSRGQDNTSAPKTGVN